MGQLNQRNSVLDVLAKNYDDSRNTLVVEYQGRTLTLAAREAKVVSSGNAAQAMPPPAPMPVAQAMPAAVTNAVVVNPTPADEQRRLEAVATEVARRRALREQAVQQVGQGTVQAVAPQAQMPRNFPPNQQGQNQQRPNQQNNQQNNQRRAQNPQSR